MQISFYQVDAFAAKVFEGNPAAVCVLDHWLDESIMQSIAAENNLAETAFCVAYGEIYQIRWFTPDVEVDLCGHATLASAHVLFNELGYQRDTIVFDSKSGELSVSMVGESLQLDFPSEPPLPCDPPSGLAEALGVDIDHCYKNIDYLVVVDSEETVRNIRPNYGGLASLDARGVIVTAKSNQYDFVNRFFAPSVGVDEDPVTGSAFTKLIPFWANELGKTSLSAKQVSRRGGEVRGELCGDRVKIIGDTVLFAKGEITISN